MQNTYTSAIESVGSGRYLTKRKSSNLSVSSRLRLPGWCGHLLSGIYHDYRAVYCADPRLSALLESHTKPTIEHWLRICAISRNDPRHDEKIMSISLGFPSDIEGLDLATRSAWQALAHLIEQGYVLVEGGG